MPPSSYDTGKPKEISAEQLQKSAASRIQKIKSHLEVSPTRGSRLKDKVCVITGVGSKRGIGRASAFLFAHEGARSLYLLDLNAKNFPALKSDISRHYPDVKVTSIQADAADETAIAGLCDQIIREEGRLDVFFANAGIATGKTLTDISPEFFMRTMRINALSCFLAIKYASQAMSKTDPARGKEFPGGSIILTASAAGLRAGAGPVDYSASKAAVNSMVKTSAYQLQKMDIRVNSICPGLVDTEMTRFAFTSKQDLAGIYSQLVPLGRHAEAEEIAQTALFLASDDSSYVNGQNIAVDGGLSASHPIALPRFT